MNNDAISTEQTDSLGEDTVLSSAEEVYPEIETPEENTSEKTDNIDETVQSASEYTGDTPSDNSIDKLLSEDMKALKEEFPELTELKSVAELQNPTRYAALRDLGLSPAEAYILTSRNRLRTNGRAHLVGGMPRTATTPKGSMSQSEMDVARELFSDISDAEIQKLFKKVTR